MARDASVAKAGYFPLDTAGFDDIASVLRVPAAKYGPSGHLTMLDPCAGQGESLRLARALGRKHIAAADTARQTARTVAVDVRWCEMEDTRAAACVAAWEAAEREQKARWSLAGERGYLRREVSCETATGDAFRLPPLGAFASASKGSCAGDGPWASLLYLNPPYDDDPEHGRLEARWLDRFTQRAQLAADGLVADAHLGGLGEALQLQQQIVDLQALAPGGVAGRLGGALGGGLHRRCKLAHSARRRRLGWPRCSRALTSAPSLDKLPGLIYGPPRVSRGAHDRPPAGPVATECFATMSSNTSKTWVRRDRRHVKMGRLRKRVESRKSTPSAVELFAALGEPGKPAPSTQS